ncbi:MAG: hypothetical protein ACI9OD_005131 [Limisphaerales bacterium]|jgi:hypothetical protein
MFASFYLMIPQPNDQAQTPGWVRWVDEDFSDFKVRWSGLSVAPGSALLFPKPSKHYEPVVSAEHAKLTRGGIETRTPIGSCLKEEDLTLIGADRNRGFI